MSGMKTLLWAVLAMILGVSARSEPLVLANSNWKYFKGRSEASSPATTNWRSVGFDDTSWSTGAEPFYYENDPGSATAYSGNTALTDMRGGYTCIFLRQAFVVTNAAQISQLRLTALCDDGFVALDQRDGGGAFQYAVGSGGI